MRRGKSFHIRKNFLFDLSCSLVSVETNYFLFNFWSFFYIISKNLAPPPQRNTLPKEISFREFNSGENLPTKITLYNSTRKIEREKRTARHIKRILYRKSCKFIHYLISLEKFTPGNFPPYGKSLRGKISSRRFVPSTHKIYACLPITNTMYKQWSIFYFILKTFPLVLWRGGGHVIFERIPTGHFNYNKQNGYLEIFIGRFWGRRVGGGA